MRTKTLLLTAALSAAGIATSMAQVYSVNAVGYVNVSIPIVTSGTVGTFALISNPLNGTNNLLSTILPNPPDNTAIYAFRSGGFEISTFVTGVGWLPDTTLAPGEGVFVGLDATAAPNPTVLTFVGEVPQGSLSNPLPSGFSLRASQVPQAGRVTTDLLLPATDNDTVYQFDRATQDYDISTFVEGVGWLPTEPSVAVAESFWFSTATARSWDRTFSVN